MRVTAIIFLVLLIPTTLLAFSGGPPDGKTGAPGEGVCTDCHSTYPLNSGDGSLNISAPSYFMAGQTYSIMVTLADSGQSRWGFEITQFGDGSFGVTDPTNTQLSSSGGKDYIKHTSTGTNAGTPHGPTSWSFDWTAPATPPDSVVLYAAGNAANNNNNNQGDYIYTASTVLYFTEAIPTLNEWGMIILSLLLLAMGTVAVIRRKSVVASSRI
jgi:hypothetical protein